MNMGLPPDTSKALVGYARVSTSDQKLDMQLDALDAAGCDPIFTDHGVSGAKAKRPGLDKALKTIKTGDVMVVYKLDRLGRSVTHLAQLLNRFNDEGINFCSLSEGINTTTPGGKLVYHVFSAVAEFQRDLIRENTMVGIEAARKRGKHIGRPFVLEEAAILCAYEGLGESGASVDEMASRLNVSYSTMLRAFKRYGLSSP